jgi:hypothetical protein
MPVERKRAQGLFQETVEHSDFAARANASDRARSAEVLRAEEARAQQKQQELETLRKPGA